MRVGAFTNAQLSVEIDSSNGQFEWVFNNIPFIDVYCQFYFFIKNYNHWLRNLIMNYMLYQIKIYNKFLKNKWTYFETKPMM
jgi:hypothetical protein